jgi:hypothetical protein
MFKNPDLIRRIKFYAFGFFLGLIAVSFIYKGKGCKMPGTLKLEELTSQQIEHTIKSKCKLQCMNITDSSLVKVLESGRVNYDESNVRNKPYPIYAIDVIKPSVRVIIEDVDAISRITDVINLASPNNTCGCN